MVDNDVDGRTVSYPYAQGDTIFPGCVRPLRAVQVSINVNAAELARCTHFQPYGPCLDGKLITGGQSDRRIREEGNGPTCSQGAVWLRSIVPFGETHN